MANHSHEAKLSIVLRTLLSFVLFVMVSLLSVAVCAKAVMINPKNIEKYLTSYEYSMGVSKSVTDYAADVYVQNGLSPENLELIFDCENVKQPVLAYAAYQITSTIGYTKDSYIEEIDKVCKAFDDDLKAQVTASGQTLNENKSNDISTSVRDYFKSEIEIVYINQIKTVMNVGSVATAVIIGISAFFTFSAALILFFIGTKRYRSIRAIAISFISAGLFNIILAFIVYIISLIKHIDIYPIYLSTAFMDYIYSCIANTAVSGGLLLLISLIILTIIWKVRKES